MPRRTHFEVELETGEVARYRRHENGRGLVSTGAEVNPSAYVSSAAYVESDAQVGDQSWIGQGSWIDRGAILGTRVFVGANVHVGADAIIGHGARLASNTTIGRGALIADGAVIDHELQIPDFTDVSAAPAGRARWVQPVAPSLAADLDHAGWLRSRGARQMA